MSQLEGATASRGQGQTPYCAQGIRTARGGQRCLLSPISRRPGRCQVLCLLSLTWVLTPPSPHGRDPRSAPESLGSGARTGAHQSPESALALQAGGQAGRGWQGGGAFTPPRRAPPSLRLLLPGSPSSGSSLTQAGASSLIKKRFKTSTAGSTGPQLPRKGRTALTALASSIIMQGFLLNCNEKKKRLSASETLGGICRLVF